MASFFDKVVTYISAPDLVDNWEAQAETERMLLERAERNRANATSPEQELAWERQIQALKGSQVDIAEGNGKIFADAAAEGGKNYINALAGGILKTVPAWLWILLALGAAIYVSLYLGLLKKASP